MPLISVEEARSMLPKVGDRLLRVPTLHKSLSMTRAKPHLCTVTHVNRERLWYSVRFDRYGYTESYKVPELEREGGQ